MNPNNILSMVNYQASSYVIIENQPNSKKNEGAFFIIRSGKVQVETLVDQMLGLGSHVLEPGGFFGVISAMSAQESNETAITLTNCSLIMVKRTKFGDLVLEAPSIALKIIRALSNDLRHYDNELAVRMVDKHHSLDNALNLFRTGEFFYNAGNFNYAALIFLAYIEYHSEGAQKQQAQSYLTKMNLKIKPQNGFSRTYLDGEMICAEYMPGSELYIVHSGKVKITKVINDQEMILAILDTGEIVGEMSLLNDKTRTANIIAYGDTKIMAIDRNNFERVVLQNKELSTKLLTVLADRLWTIYKQLGNLLIEDPLNRLWDTLLTQLLKQHIKCERQAKHQFSFGKTELLNMCGLSAEVGEEAFNNLISNHHISLTDDNRLQCSDLEELKKTVEFAHKMEIRARKMRMAKKQDS